MNASLSKAHSESLKMLHKLCYNTTGTATKRKRDLKRFNGFGFDEQSSEFGKKKITAMKLTNMEAIFFHGFALIKLASMLPSELLVLF